MGALLGEPGGGAPLLRALKVMKGRLWGWASLFMGAQLGNLEWAHLPGTLRYGERGSGGRVSLSVGALRREPGGRAPLLETLKDM